jgi:hypothetical protein
MLLARVYIRNNCEHITKSLLELVGQWSLEMGRPTTSSMGIPNIKVKYGRFFPQMRTQNSDLHMTY